jgi:cyanuric acid amidohydrolase
LAVDATKLEGVFIIDVSNNRTADVSLNFKILRCQAFCLFSSLLSANNLFESKSQSPPAPVHSTRSDLGAKRLVVDVINTRIFLPEEIGRLAQVKEVSECVKRLMKRCEIASSTDVHFVQIKCPLLTSVRVQDAESRSQTVITKDADSSMGYSRGAAALGVALALDEIPESKLSEESVCQDWSLFSNVASASAGVELMHCEIIVMGNSATSNSELVVGHSVMKDAIDSRAVQEALQVFFM